MFLFWLCPILVSKLHYCEKNCDFFFFLKFSFVFLPCLCFSWAPSIKVFVSVSVSHLEAFLKYLVVVAVFSYLK